MRFAPRVFALLPLACCACAALSPEPSPPAAGAASQAAAMDRSTEQAIAQARMDTAAFGAGMDEMIARQAQMQKMMLVMLDQAMSPELIGALATSAKQFEAAFVDAGLANPSLE